MALTFSVMHVTQQDIGITQVAVILASSIVILPRVVQMLLTRTVMHAIQMDSFSMEQSVSLVTLLVFQQLDVQVQPILTVTLVT